MFHFLSRITLLCLLFAPAMAFSQQEGWTQLFNGKDLNDWQLVGGKAEYNIEGDAIVGTCKANTPNTFLCTKKKYADFILEFEVWVDPALNSGVQFRSNTDPSYRDGVLHGYQVEIESTPRAFSGGIYDEQRRGWLYPMSRNPKGGQAFRPGEWNQYRVEAIGNTIKTWVNGVQCAHLVDDATAEGHIGLQVHSIYNEEFAGKITKWRNIRIKTENTEQDRWADDPSVPQLSYLTNELTEWEKRRGYRLLWDGKTSQGWRGVKPQEFPREGWTIESGVLTINGTENGERPVYGDIITEALFSNFEIELEVKLTARANSGVKYFVFPEMVQQGNAVGLEFQLVDDATHPDAKAGIEGNRAVGSLYDLISAENLSVPGRGKQFKGVGQWNHVRIVVKGSTVEHWLNHEKVVEYNRSSQPFRALVATSKYKNYKNFGQIPAGHILLQDHGNTVHFRSIKIREF